MTLIATEILIAAPRDRVWAVLTDFAAFADWNPYLVAVEGEARAGSVLTVTSVPVPGGAPMTQPVDVTAVKDFTMIWEGGMPDRSLFRGHHRFILETADGGCRFIHDEQFSGTQADAILSRYSDIIRASFERFNAALKRRAEALLPSA